MIIVAWIVVVLVVSFVLPLMGVTMVLVGAVAIAIGSFLGWLLDRSKPKQTWFD